MDVDQLNCCLNRQRASHARAERRAHSRNHLVPVLIDVSSIGLVPNPSGGNWLGYDQQNPAGCIFGRSQEGLKTAAHLNRRADTGGTQRFLKLHQDDRYYLCGLGSQFRLVEALKIQDPQGWKNRALNERFRVPLAVAEQVFDNRFHDVPTEWDHLSSEYASALASFYSPDADPPETMLIRKVNFSLEEVRESKVAQEAFDKAGVSERLMRSSLERLVADPRWRPGARRSWVELKRLVGGVQPDPLDEDEAALSMQEEKDLSEWFSENERFAEHVCDAVRREMALKEIQHFVDKANSLGEHSYPERKRAWESLLLRYPYFHFADYEVAIAEDMSGASDQALDHILRAILAAPTDSARWDSLGVIARKLNRHEEAAGARAVAHMLKERL